MGTINSNALPGGMPSLVNYLNKSSGNGFTGQYASGNAGAGTGSGATLTGAGGDTVTLSPQAQALLAQAQARTSAAATSSGDAALNETQAAAQAFIAGFFDDNAVDISKVSDETISLFQGLSEIINDMAAPTQNAAIDKGVRVAGKGARASFTLESPGHTVSFLIKYENGKPAGMSVTNVTGLTAETAVLTLSRDATGAPATLNVTSEKNTYNRFGGKTAGVEREALNFALYRANS